MKILYRIAVPALFLLGVASAIAQGLGISSEVYARRFNALAEEAAMPEHFRMRSTGAKVTTLRSRTVATIKLDARTTIHLGYGDDRQRMTDVILVRPIGSTHSERLETVAAITVAVQAAFETPDQRGSALAVQACGEAMETGKSAERKHGGRTVNCYMADGALMMEIS